MKRTCLTGCPGHSPQPGILPKAGSCVLHLKAGLANGVSKPAFGPAVHVWKWEELRGQILLSFAQLQRPYTRITSFSGEENVR